MSHGIRLAEGSECDQVAGLNYCLSSYAMPKQAGQLPSAAYFEMRVSEATGRLALPCSGSGSCLLVRGKAERSE